MDTTNHGRASDAFFTSDEDGFELHVETEDGERHVFNVQHITSKLLPIAYPLEQYWNEGLAAAASYVPPVSQEDLDAYEPNDPKRIALENA
jgi:hypothetical protein